MEILKKIKKKAASTCKATFKMNNFNDADVFQHTT